MPTIGIIIPTCGRASLREALVSVRPQTRPGDRVVVVADGPQPAAQGLARGVGADYLETHATRWYGNHQMNVGLDHLGTGVDLCLQLDDDDYLAPTALADIRAAGKAHPGDVLMFRMQTPTGVLWNTQTAAPGNTGSGNFVFPTGNPARFSDRDSEPDGGHSDYWFIRDYLADHSGGVVWCEPVIYHVPQRGYGVVPAHP